jgi:hypothetical protein
MEISPGLLAPLQVLQPQMTCQPKYGVNSGGELYAI